VGINLLTLNISCSCSFLQLWIAQKLLSQRLAEPVVCIATCTVAVYKLIDEYK